MKFLTLRLHRYRRYLLVFFFTIALIFSFSPASVSAECAGYTAPSCDPVIRKLNEPNHPNHWVAGSIHIIRDLEGVIYPIYPLSWSIIVVRKLLG